MRFVSRRAGEDQNDNRRDKFGIMAGGISIGIECFVSPHSKYVHPSETHFIGPTCYIAHIISELLFIFIRM